MTCLIRGSFVDLSLGFHHHVKLMPFNKDYDESENDRGVTVIDISEPHNVRYCFVDYWEIRTGELATLICADTFWRLCLAHYLARYHHHHLIDAERQEKKINDMFAGKNLIAADSLRDTWPNSEWQDGIDTETEAEEQKLVSHGKTNIKSLRASAMEVTIKMALKQSDSEMSWVSQADDGLRNKAYEQADTLVPTRCMLYLLAKSLQGISGFSLGAFRNFALEDLCTVISDLQTMETTSILNLSNIGFLDQAGLQKILQITPVLQTLYLMETPCLSITSVLSLLHDSSFNVANLYHSDLFRLPLPRPGKNQFPTHTLKFPTGANTRSPIVQMLWVRANTLESASRNGGLTDWDFVAAEMVKSWNCPKLGYGMFPLDDILLPPAKIITGMIRFAHFMQIEQRYFEKSYSNQAAATAFAPASSTIESPELHVGPMPQVLASTIFTESRRRCTKMRSSKPGDWSIIVVSELKKDVHPDSKWKYAFVTPSADESREPNRRFVVKDMSSFLAEVVEDANEAEKLNELWEELRHKYADFIEPCSERDAHELIRALFLPSEQKSGEEGTGIVFLPSEQESGGEGTGGFFPPEQGNDEEDTPVDG